ncbi:MAG: hypothetical protein JST32_13250 [Bacteroidetes bacterium]|nr:hypothetical protein [Bacteroidota bacterium]
MKPTAKIILIFSPALFLALFIIYYLTDIFPEFLFNTTIRLNGLLIFCITLTISIIVQKQFFKANPTANIAQLALLSTTIVFIAEAIFQIIRAFSYSSDRLFYYLSGTIGMVIFFGIVSILIALQLKTGRTVLVIIFSIAFALSIKFILPIFSFTIVNH